MRNAQELGIVWGGRGGTTVVTLIFTELAGTGFAQPQTTMKVCRENSVTLHQKNFLMEFSRTNGLIYEINSLSLRTLKQGQGDNLLGGDSCTRRDADLSA